MIAVGRLIFSVPGMSPERAERLARTIGSMVAETGAASVERVEATVDADATDASIIAALAASLRTGAR